jgi:hypothetical protein
MQCVILAHCSLSCCKTADANLPTAYRSAGVLVLLAHKFVRTRVSSPVPTPYWNRSAAAA